MTQKKNSINKSLIEECKKGDSQAQFTLYSMYARAMFNLAYRIVNNREDAEDMLQEAIIVLWQKACSDDFSLKSTRHK